MSIFLHILLIIGIVILCIVGFLLAVVLLVLFAPVHYKTSGFYEEGKYELVAGISWLFHILSVSFNINRKDRLIIRLFGFRLNNSKKNTDSENPDYGSDDDFFISDTDDFSGVKSNDSQEKAEEDNTGESMEKPDISKDIFPNMPLNGDAPENISDDSDSFEIDKVIERAEQSFEHAKSKIEDKVSSKRSLCDKIKRYIEIIDSNRFRKAFEYSKDKLVRLLKHILPHRYEIRAVCGFEDPSLTGRVLAIYSMLFPWISKHVYFKADFENETVKIYGRAKGHLFVFKVLVIAASVYFNKNIRKILKMFREV